MVFESKPRVSLLSLSAKTECRPVKFIYYSQQFIFYNYVNQIMNFNGSTDISIYLILDKISYHSNNNLQAKFINYYLSKSDPIIYYYLIIFQSTSSRLWQLFDKPNLSIHLLKLFRKSDISYQLLFNIFQFMLLVFWLWQHLSY